MKRTLFQGQDGDQNKRRPRAQGSAARAASEPCSSTGSRRQPHSTAAWSEDLAEEIQHLHEREALLRPDANGFCREQTEVTMPMRLVLVEWLTEVVEEFHLSAESFFLAVGLLDRFLCSSFIPRRSFQLLGVTCIWVAAKYEEVYPPSAAELVAMTDNTYTSSDVLRMEHKLLSCLDFELGAPTPLRFLHFFLNKADVQSPAVAHLAECLLELSMLDARHSLSMLPSQCAAAALYAALGATSRASHLPAVLTMAGCDAEELQELAQDMLCMFEIVCTASRPCPILARYKASQLQASASLTVPRPLAPVPLPAILTKPFFIGGGAARGPMPHAALSLEKQQGAPIAHCLASHSPASVAPRPQSCGNVLTSTNMSTVANAVAAASAAAVAATAAMLNSAAILNSAGAIAAIALTSAV